MTAAAIGAMSGMLVPFAPSARPTAIPNRIAAEASRSPRSMRKPSHHAAMTLAIAPVSG